MEKWPAMMAMMEAWPGNDWRKPRLAVQGIWDCTAALKATQGDWKGKHCDDDNDCFFSEN